MSDTEDITTETANTVGGAAIYNASSTVTKRFAEHLAEKKASVHFHAFPLVWMIFFIRKKRKKKKKVEMNSSPPIQKKPAQIRH